MKLEFIDWIIVLAYILITLLVGFWFKKKAGKNLSSYFLGSKNLTWFVAGISMVATTFAADTPLAVTELVRQNGISGNWLWWNFLIGGMLTTFFFSKLWRRANVLTEIEFIQIRYSGIAAVFLRGFKSLYFGLVINTLFIGWVNMALASILSVFFDIPPKQIIWFVALSMTIAASYSVISGLSGVVYTDVLQFFIALGGAIVLAFFIVSSKEVGGIIGLKAKLPEGSLHFFPTINSSSSNSEILSTFSLSIGTLVAYLGIQWWASVYPGAEPGGGGFIAQRMMSTKDERSSLWATLLFQISHYAIRPWPWILVGLSTIVIYPHLIESEYRLGYVMAIKDFLPAGFIGLLFVSLLAAYMSTISTALNLSASFLVNDFYKRFITEESSFKNEMAADRHYVLVSKITTVLIMIISLFATTLFTSISEVWKIVLEGTAGLGLVMILRWYWWRINVWSEITAIIVPLLVFIGTRYVWVVDFPQSFFFTVGITTVSWLAITMITKSTDSDVLKSFYQRVKPGIGWKPFYDASQSHDGKMDVVYSFICLFSSIIMTYSFLFFMGKLIFQEWTLASLLFMISLFSFFGLRWAMNRIVH